MCVWYAQQFGDLVSLREQHYMCLKNWQSRNWVRPQLGVGFGLYYAFIQL